MHSITVDSDREERPVNRYGSQAIARTSGGDVGEYKLRKFIQVEIFVCVIDLSFEIEISEFAVRFSFGIKRILPFVSNGSMKLKGRKIIKYVIL